VSQQWQGQQEQASVHYHLQEGLHYKMGKICVPKEEIVLLSTKLHYGEFPASRQRLNNIVQNSEFRNSAGQKTTWLLYISIKNCNKRCWHDEFVKGLSHLKS
jgi:hypothetical protein